ncbi:MAG: hypothetical protein ACLUD2_05290 [Clostridium sp.]
MEKWASPPMMSQALLEPVKKASDASVDSGTGAARGSASSRVRWNFFLRQDPESGRVDAWADALWKKSSIRQRVCRCGRQYCALDLPLLRDRTTAWLAPRHQENCTKEQQFVMGIPAREIGPVDSDELVVIQRYH